MENPSRGEQVEEVIGTKDLVVFFSSRLAFEVRSGFPLRRSILTEILLEFCGELISCVVNEDIYTKGFME